MSDTIKYLDKLNDIKNRYSIPYTKEDMKEEHCVEIMYEELSIEMIKEIERLNKGLTELDNMFYETFRISQNGYYSISEWELKEFTDKIKELKGSESNE